MSKALLVIDLQMCYLELNSTPEKTEKLLMRVNSNIAYAQAQGWLIIYIKHYFDHPLAKIFFKLFFKGAGIRGTPKTAFDPRLHIVNGNILEKNTEDTFKSTSLNQILKEHNVDELYITGQDGTACINSTSWGALKHNYKVHLVDDSIISGNGKGWTKMKEKLLQQSNCDLIETLP